MLFQVTLVTNLVNFKRNRDNLRSFAKVGLDFVVKNIDQEKPTWRSKSRHDHGVRSGKTNQLELLS